jgi:starch phosphorylase
LLCKTIGQRTFNNYLSANHNKAMAIGWGKTGYGVRWGTDDPGLAMLGALYHCNHAKNNPKLCRLVSVNEHEVLPLYFDRDRRGFSPGWVHMAKSSMKSIMPRFNMQRMLTDYAEKFYSPAAEQWRKYAGDGFSGSV